jgi:NADH-quinone oxidoreductase subunit L
MHPVFLLAPMTLNIVGGIGAATALFAALSAVGQTDLKRVLAYSTVSQLGYMFLACGVGAFYAAMFHLTMHAFVKALLFLAAGNVIHMTHDNTDMRKMGGLAKYFPWTKWLLLIGVLALSGVPPLSAFFSKDLILEEGNEAGFHILYVVGLLTAAITAFYLTRAYCLTFLGSSRRDSHAEISEAPTVMLAPVSVLGVLSLIGGFLGFCFCTTPVLATFLSEVGISIPSDEFNIGFILSPETLMSIAGSIAGIGIAAYIYTHYSDHPIELFKRSFYINELYWYLIVVPVKKLGDFIAGFVESKIFKGSIHCIVKGTQNFAGLMQHFQSGQIRSYVAWMLAGTVLLIVYFIF